MNPVFIFALVVLVIGSALVVSMFAMSHKIKDTEKHHE